MIYKTFIVIHKTMGQCFPCFKRVHDDSHEYPSTRSSPRVPVGRVISPSQHAQIKNKTFETFEENSYQAQTQMAIGYTGRKTKGRPM